ncbi:MAG: cupin domain-containing protein, partial [Bacteroidaceae bacterium]
MTSHPEGGYFREEYRAGKSILTEGRTSGRSAMTTIFYLLEKDDFSAFHRIQSPESWFFHRGVPLLIYSFEKGTLICRELSDQESGTLQITIEPGVWFAACLKEKRHFALVSCAVAPGFEYEEFELAERS